MDKIKENKKVKEKENIVKGEIKKKSRAKIKR